MKAALGHQSRVYIFVERLAIVGDRRKTPVIFGLIERFPAE
jgi:hypothetical protein